MCQKQPSEVPIPTLKVHFTTSRPPSRVPSRKFILDEGCHTVSETTVGSANSDNNLGNPHQELKFLMELLMKVLAW